MDDVFAFQSEIPTSIHQTSQRREESNGTCLAIVNDSFQTSWASELLSFGRETNSSTGGCHDGSSEYDQLRELSDRREEVQDRANEVSILYKSKASYTAHRTHPQHRMTIPSGTFLRS